MTFSILLHLFQVDYTCFYPEIRIRVKFLNWEQKKKNPRKTLYAGVYYNVGQETFQTSTGHVSGTIVIGIIFRTECTLQN